VLTERCKLADRVVLQVGNALDLPYSDETFDVAWRVARGTTIFAKGDPGSGLMGVLAGTIKHDSSEGWRAEFGRFYESQNEYVPSGKKD
jgi:hypothetical protein